MAKKRAKKTGGRPAGAPEHLSDGAAERWEELRLEWRIEDRAGLMLLTKACEAWDRAERCRIRIDADGEAIEDRFGQFKPHPLLACERDSRAAFASLIRQLGIEPDDEV